jgi:hypothetical protein
MRRGNSEEFAAPFARPLKLVSRICHYRYGEMVLGVNPIATESTENPEMSKTTEIIDFYPLWG